MDVNVSMAEIYWHQSDDDAGAAPQWVQIFSEGAKGQLISKANCQVVNSSKKRMNEFVSTTMRPAFVRFSEEIDDTKKTFRN